MASPSVIHLATTFAMIPFAMKTTTTLHLLLQPLVMPAMSRHAHASMPIMMMMMHSLGSLLPAAGLHLPVSSRWRRWQALDWQLLPLLVMPAGANDTD